ncbi:MAG: hypothetical protein ACYDHP_10440 [Ferrimicrobium sp.]
MFQAIIALGAIGWLVIAVVLIAAHVPLAVAFLWPVILWTALKARKVMSRRGL